MKFLVAILVVFVVACSGEDTDGYYGYPEEGCSREGGRCILKTQCEPDQVASSPNLCPKQESQGYICCHGYPKDEHHCKNFGGECSENKECRTREPRATDCGSDQVCCVLV